MLSRLADEPWRVALETGARACPGVRVTHTRARARTPSAGVFSSPPRCADDGGGARHQARLCGENRELEMENRRHLEEIMGI
jgi:hypothetical protein